ncbi:MAG: hypothetical protein QOE83_436 [Actinomycetota bacterium]|nr:hypothetical protein [Actinomycetota bacterium]
MNRSASRPRHRLTPAIFLALLGVPSLLAPAIATARPNLATQASSRVTDPVIAAAGDIACDPSNPYFNKGMGSNGWCLASKTGNLIAHLGPNAVLPLGDAQYNTGKLGQYNASYALSWGGYLPASHPVPGNHDYESSSSANGYFDYFGVHAAPPGASDRGFYSYQLGTWHLISLNSNCSYVRCGPGSAQYEWLKNDLIANSSACTLAYWHAPRFSSGPHGNYLSVGPFWNLLFHYGADVILNGHDHIYERFAPQNPSGNKAPMFGLREFVVGTGGAQHYWIDKVKAHSVVRNAKTFGILKMTLHPNSYGWSFLPVAGLSFHDAGTASCHGKP